METRNIIAIDSHTHINHDVPSDSPNIGEVSSAHLEHLRKMNMAANIDKMLCSTFASVLNAETVIEENEYMQELCRQYGFLYQWVVIDPRNDKTFKQAREMLGREKCVGIKIHPPCHQYILDDYADKIFSFAAEYDAIVQIHPIESDPFADYANKYRNVKIIIAHLGNIDCMTEAKYGNLYTDTSGISSSKNNVIEYAVKKIGSERILFGTDTYASGFQRGRIEYAMISDADKENILLNNAKRLFDL